MRTTLSLYRLAERKNIPVERFPAPETGSLCIATPSGRNYICLDPAAIETECDERVHLAHELGHCCTGSFYNRYAARDLRQKHENHADRWAIKKLVPKDELEAAIASGLIDSWELADYFNVTEPFIIKAVAYYKMLDQAS